MATYLYRRGISYYLPLMEKATRVGGLQRVRTRLVPVFGGYICLALDREDHGLLYDTHKFVKIIPVEDQETFVSQLGSVAHAIESKRELIVRQGLARGKRIEILSGPLAGTIGVVVSHNKKKHLAVSVEMFNQNVLVRLDPETLVVPLEDPLREPFAVNPSVT